MEKISDNQICFTQYFIDYCNEKGYQANVTEMAYAKRIDISNLSETTIVLVYNSSTIQVQGKNNALQKEIIELKDTLLSTETIDEFSLNRKNQRIMRYPIILHSLQTLIRESIAQIEGNSLILEKTDDNVNYRVRVSRSDNTIVITQYKSGTLLLQGRDCLLFNDCCDLIEKTANPTEADVISRFVPDSYNVILTKQSVQQAEYDLKRKIGDVYDYLEPHDLKWFISSEFLCSLNLPLPEFSPLVMPASKAFEGFCKKILVDIGLYGKDYFKGKRANFKELKDTNNGNRKRICEGYKYGQTMLDILSVGLDEYRNFMMHSDDEEITKVNTKEEAVKLVNSIFDDTKKVFDYFNKKSDLL